MVLQESFMLFSNDGINGQYINRPSFPAEDVEKVQDALRRFYDYPKVVELRHKSWSEHNAQTKALLGENRASGVLIDEPKFATSISTHRRYILFPGSRQKRKGVVESQGVMGTL
jgi:uncharacterized protein YecE (DUF72 family)